MEALQESLEKLVGKFDADKAFYLSKEYPEAQARVDFITPFFKALGWDVENEAGRPHHEREVVVERGESDTTGRPDYSFRVSGQTKFLWKRRRLRNRSTIPATSCKQRATPGTRRSFSSSC
jgi:predicted type IV restriction endonuclease